MKQSERLDIAIALTLVLILALACLPAHSRTKTVNIEIPPQCVKKVLLVDCDAGVNPPKCKSANVTYSPASCAVVQIQ